MSKDKKANYTSPITETTDLVTQDDIAIGKGSDPTSMQLARPSASSEEEEEPATDNSWEE